MRAKSSRSLRTALSLTLGGVAIGYWFGRESARHAAIQQVHATTPVLAQKTTGALGDEHPRAPTIGRLETLDTTSESAAWRALKNQPLTPAIEEQMRAYLLQLGANNFVAALARAQEANTPRQRELFRNAALQGLATRDAQAAVSWTLSHVRASERRAAVEAIAAGAVTQPEEAIRAFHQLTLDDPLLASDHGNALVSAFAHAGQFQTASDFAAAGPTQFRAAWLSNVYHSWAVCQPQAALASLNNIADTAARKEATNGLYAGWASSDPAGLVAYAQTLPVGESRLDALKEGLTQWVYRDSTAASDWMDKFDPSPDLDAGAAAIAVMPALVERKPDIAASWAESITDPELRANTLLDLIRLWAEHDALAARKYASTSTALRPETRALALSILTPEP